MFSYLLTFIIKNKNSEAPIIIVKQKKFDCIDDFNTDTELPLPPPPAIVKEQSKQKSKKHLYHHHHCNHHHHNNQAAAVLSLDLFLVNVVQFHVTVFRVLNFGWFQHF